MGPAVALGDTEIGEQQRTGLERIEVPRSACRVSLVAGGGDEFVGEFGRFPWRDHHPADHVAAEHPRTTGRGARWS